jgi:hypothetical protein
VPLHLSLNACLRKEGLRAGISGRAKQWSRRALLRPCKWYGSCGHEDQCISGIHTSSTHELSRRCQRRSADDAKSSHFNMACSSPNALQRLVGKMSSHVVHPRYEHRWFWRAKPPTPSNITQQITLSPHYLTQPPTVITICHRPAIPHYLFKRRRSLTARALPATRFADASGKTCQRLPA